MRRSRHASVLSDVKYNCVYWRLLQHSVELCGHNKDSFLIIDRCSVIGMGYKVVIVFC